MYFVILNHPEPSVYFQLVDDEGYLFLFDNRDDAIKAGKENPLGECYGFEVFEIGTGDSF